MARDRDDDRRSSRNDDRGFRYERRSTEDVKRRASEKSGNFSSFIKGDFKKYKMKDGKNVIRILPPTWPKPKHYAYTIYLNYRIGADNQTFLSLSEMLNEKDPLAEARKEAQREGDKEMAKALTPQKRSLMWIIDRMDEDEGPQLFDCPFGVDTDFVNLSIDEDTKEVIYFDDPDEGCDIRFYREPGKPYPKYPAAKMKILAPSPLSEDKGLQKEWIGFITENPVPDCLQYYGYEHIQEAFDGVIGSYDDDGEKSSKGKSRDDDDDEKPRRGERYRAAEHEDDDEPAPKARARREPEDDDSDAEEKPARRSRQRLEDDSEDGGDEPRGNKRGNNGKQDEADEDADGERNARPSIRERLQQRRAQTRPDDE
jgi:hypothetical protein